jgi:hypothetical protein
MSRHRPFVIILVALIAYSSALHAEGEPAVTTYAGSIFEVQTLLGLRSSVLPGPPRGNAARPFSLTATNSLAMKGIDDPENERWCDVAGNSYSSEFIRRFSYSKPSTNGPLVRLFVDKKGPTFSGKLEAHGLKPNFAYQMKLRGVFKHRKSFEAIGYAGRWRLPGLYTNYRDEDYIAYAKKEDAEAYIFFDYFVTDADGKAIRDFALDSCLHVIWSASHQRLADRDEDMFLAIVWAKNPEIYSRPKNQGTIERIWSEIESPRYKSIDQKRFLPAGDYNAEMVLTEESFHSWYRDGGYWATVYSAPVQFTVTTEKQATDIQPKQEQ